VNILIPQYFKAINWFDSYAQKCQWKTKETNKNKQIQILERPVPDTAGHTVLLTDCMHMEIGGDTHITTEILLNRAQKWIR